VRAPLFLGLFGEPPNVNVDPISKKRFVFADKNACLGDTPRSAATTPDYSGSIKTNTAAVAAPQPSTSSDPASPISDNPDPACEQPPGPGAGSTPCPRLYEGTQVEIPAKYLADAYRVGWDYGALVVPFKMQLSDGKPFTGSASVGGYLGYRFPLFDTGLVFSPVAFAGASNILTSATTGGKTTSQTVAGISYGFGLITDVKDGFQAGVIYGYDHVNSAQPYLYNNKPWISFEIGYSFAK
jgi:hypothetical protein